MSTPRDYHHGVYCCVRVVVTVVDCGSVGDGADVVVVRSMVVVCVGGLDPQAASSAVPPSNAAITNSRMPDFVSIMIDLLGQCRVGRSAHRFSEPATG
jgi:hypothetical protein